MDIPTWGLLILAAVGGAATILVGKFANKLFQGRAIDEVVNSANNIIKMYENHISLLEKKVDDLKTEMGGLKIKLEETMAHNAALQKLLLASPAITLPPEATK